MKPLIKNLSIVPYLQNNKNNHKSYTDQLKTLVEDITILDWIKNKFKLKLEVRDFLIKFKKFTDKQMF